jgi:hypothetical protein
MAGLEIKLQVDNNSLPYVPPTSSFSGYQVTTFLTRNFSIFKLSC